MKSVTFTSSYGKQCEVFFTGNLEELNIKSIEIDGTSYPVKSETRQHLIHKIAQKNGADFEYAVLH